MREPMIRGHLIMNTATSLRALCDPAEGRCFDDALSLELRIALASMQQCGWYSRRLQVELLTCFATVKRQEDSIYAGFIRCGESFVLHENPFSALLWKVLTPELFIKKQPKFWIRDHMGGGHVELESLHAHGARMRLRDAHGYDHGAIVWLGWMSRALHEIAPQGVQVMQTGWTPSTPAPADVAYEVRW